MILGRRGGVDLAMHALLEPVLVMTAMTVLLFLLWSLFLVVRGRVRFGFSTFPLSARARIVGVLGGARVRGGGGTPE